MKNEEKIHHHWTNCPECKGEGKKSQKLRKNIRLHYKKEVALFELTDKKGKAPIKPKAPLISCVSCLGSGLIASNQITPVANDTFPHVAIIGGGIGGVALAVACLHRGIPFTLYERDANFEARSQGYGLTLQQASKALKGFGIDSLQEGVISTKHLVHTTEGKVVGSWGMRKWVPSATNKKSKSTNIHIARQALRLALLQQLGESDCIKWGHQLISIKENDNQTVDLSFQASGTLQKAHANLVVGADGIRSTVRNLIIGKEKTPLRYLDCIVILGICPLSALKDIESPLLDSATVFQTGNGNERIYVMPYDKDSVMWQLSFPMNEEDTKTLSSKGTDALKKEAINRTQWHSPIPEIIAATNVSQISGYPVYDRSVLTSELLAQSKQVTLLGDAAHPMSPFKGQGANQAILDAITLARKIYKTSYNSLEWKRVGIRQHILNSFEAEMIQRSAKKVHDSAAAAQFLHSETVLIESDEPRGSCINKRK